MSTQRYAMAVRLKDEKREFYIENHANVWPEILEELKKINVKNYSIYLKEDFMFGYLEYDGNNFDDLFGHLTNSHIQRTHKDYNHSTSEIEGNKMVIISTFSLTIK